MLQNNGKPAVQMRLFTRKFERRVIKMFIAHCVKLQKLFLYLNTIQNCDNVFEAKETI